jgi:hypothetical protein
MTVPRAKPAVRPARQIILGKAKERQEFPEIIFRLAESRAATKNLP